MALSNPFHKLPLKTLSLLKNQLLHKEENRLFAPVIPTNDCSEPHLSAVLIFLLPISRLHFS